MKTGARIGAMYEILDYFFKSQKPLDSMIQEYFTRRRYAGSKDRRYIIHHTFNFFRYWETLKGEGESDDPRALLIAYLKRIESWTPEDFQTHFNEDIYSLSPLSSAEKEETEALTLPEWAHANVPEFMWKEFTQSCDTEFLAHAKALNQEALPDLRVNTLKTTREKVLKELKKLSLEAIETPYSPWGIRLGKRINLATLPLFKEGCVEMQDEGSQMLALFCDAKPGQKVLDLCAGAGGKTLALAAMMKNKGQIIATDIETHRLKRTAQRLQRAGVINTILKEWPLSMQEEQTFDLVVIDAPCSGMGTWRRSPDLRARLTPEDFQKILESQKNLLKKASLYVQKGGHLVYGTCSLLKKENEEQVKDFLDHHPDFHLTKETCLSPLIHQTDGFYGAKILRKGKNRLF